MVRWSPQGVALCSALFAVIVFRGTHEESLFAEVLEDVLEDVLEVVLEVVLEGCASR